MTASKVLLDASLLKWDGFMTQLRPSHGNAVSLCHGTKEETRIQLRNSERYLRGSSDKKVERETESAIAFHSHFV